MGAGRGRHGARGSRWLVLPHPAPSGGGAGAGHARARWHGASPCSNARHPSTRGCVTSPSITGQLGTMCCGTATDIRLSTRSGRGVRRQARKDAPRSAAVNERIAGGQSVLGWPLPWSFGRASRTGGPDWSGVSPTGIRWLAGALASKMTRICSGACVTTSDADHVFTGDAGRGSQCTEFTAGQRDTLASLRISEPPRVPPAADSRSLNPGAGPRRQYAPQTPVPERAGQQPPSCLPDHSAAELRRLRTARQRGTINVSAFDGIFQKVIVVTWTMEVPVDGAPNLAGSGA